SGVHPVSYAELFALAQIDTDSLFSTLVDYPEVNGFRRLRQKISDMYTDIGPENVLVTVGATEANTLVAQTLLQPGDNMVRFCPTYEQLPGNALNRGVEVRNVPMIEEQDWAIDGGALDAAVDQKTRLIHIVNPNNPTGRVLGGRDRHLIVAAAERVGAWIVADEVYIGTERNTDEPTQSFWGTSERVV
ncbi:MAG: aminotransferase class I/II-fold pyridoxal phosphate-dependent enzyme, partial [Rhodobacteraceae bacterium]|nr:aminotransferase class I/II-fold pyridoxal phosphate-dependent enzyme [Paracoccaceae bacterium]